jgi:hypothetical protein
LRRSCGVLCFAGPVERFGFGWLVGEAVRIMPARPFYLALPLTIKPVAKAAPSE